MQCPWCCWQCPGGFGWQQVSMARAAEGLTGGERNVPHRAELAKEVEKLLWSDVEAGGD